MVLWPLPPNWVLEVPVAVAVALLGLHSTSSCRIAVAPYASCLVECDSVANIGMAALSIGLLFYPRLPFPLYPYWYLNRPWPIMSAFVFCDCARSLCRFSCCSILCLCPMLLLIVACCMMFLRSVYLMVAALSCRCLGGPRVSLRRIAIFAHSVQLQSPLRMTSSKLSLNFGSRGLVK